MQPRHGRRHDDRPERLLAEQQVIGREATITRAESQPVEALPCGSRSTTSTFSPIAASAVPRLMAVVVLPTPPFWLATTRTRGLLEVVADIALLMILMPLNLDRAGFAHPFR